MLYTLLILLAQNYFNSRRKASVRMQPAHKHILTSSHYQNTIISCPCTECKNVALGGVDTSFFSLFSTKKCAFLLFFDYFCTFLIYIAYFWGAATVGSELRALFNCFLVVFMLKYQGGHGVWPFLKDFALKSVVVLLPLDHYQSNFYFLLAHRRILMSFSVLESSQKAYIYQLLSARGPYGPPRLRFWYHWWSLGKKIAPEGAISSHFMRFTGRPYPTGGSKPLL